MLNASWLPIRGLTFDVDGTLYSKTLLRRQMACLLLREWVGGRISRRDIRILRSFRRNVELARSLGMRSEIFAHILALTARENQCSRESVSKIVDRWIHDAPLPILEGLANLRLRQMLGRLRLRGYQLGVFSDYPAKKKLGALGLPLNLFDAIVEAGEPEVDALKPHPKGFLVLCRRMRLEPRQVLYIGDRDSIDGPGARSAGIHFGLYSPYTLGRSPKVIRNLLQLERLLGVRGNRSHRMNSGGCRLCGSTDQFEFLPSRAQENLTPESVSITDSRYGHTGRLLECRVCGFVGADEQFAHTVESLYRRLADQEYCHSTPSRRMVFSRLLKQIKAARPDARTLLDVGASTGAFCAEAEGAGFSTEAVEPSEWAVRVGRQMYGLRIHEGYFPHPAIEGKKFDVVSLLDVIEHVVDPIRVLQACRNCVSETGMLVVVTPDLKSFTARIMGRRWWHFRVAHVNHFYPETMVAALAASDFELEFQRRFTRWLSVPYLLHRVAAYFHEPTSKRHVTGSGWMHSLSWISVPVLVGDSLAFFAKPSGGDSW